MLECLKELAHLAPIVTALVAIAAVFIAVKQLRTARENEAKRQFAGYLDAGSSKPEFLSSDRSKFWNAKDVQDACAFESSYFMFLSRGLMSFDEILECFPCSDPWRKAIEYYLSIHAQDLKDILNETYSVKLSAMMSEAIKNHEQNLVKETQKMAS